MSSTKSSNIIFTDNAAKKVAGLISEEANPNLKLRVYIVGGGCSGFQYGFKFDEQRCDDDYMFTNEQHQVDLVIDAMSYNYLNGATIDYNESFQGAHFVVTNPNAKTTCGCGNSFAV